MLVNVLTRYPPPPPDSLLTTTIQNAVQFGLPSVLRDGRSLRPSAFNNVQQFGTPRLHSPAKPLAASRLVNTVVFGGPAVAPIVHGTRHVIPLVVMLASQFGGPAVRRGPKFVTPAPIVNLTAFGAPTVGALETKTFSYSNPLGSGDRTTSIIVSTSGGSIFDSLLQLVDGNTETSSLWGYGAITFKFDFGAPKVIRQVRWIQSNATNHTDLFGWQGSNDDIAYEDIGETFILGGPIFICDTLLENATAYRFYQLRPTANAFFSASPFFREIEFYIEGDINDPPD